MKNEINIQIGLLNYKNVSIFFGVNLWERGHSNPKFSRKIVSIKNQT